MEESQIRSMIVAALNETTEDQPFTLDGDSNPFDALHGEYGSVVLSGYQLDRVVELINELIAGNTDKGQR